MAKNMEKETTFSSAKILMKAIGMTTKDKVKESTIFNEDTTGSTGKFTSVTGNWIR